MAFFLPFLTTVVHNGGGAEGGRCVAGRGLGAGSTPEGLVSVTLKGIGVSVSGRGASALRTTISSVRISTPSEKTDPAGDPLALHRECPDLRCYVPCVLRQRHILPTSRLPQTLELVLLATSAPPDVSRLSSLLLQLQLILCFLRRRPASGAAAPFFFSHLTFHVSHLTPHWSGELIIGVSRKSLLYLLVYTVSRCRILTHSGGLILSSGLFNKPR